MLKFVLGYLKTNKMRKNSVKRLLFVTMYAPDRYKTYEMCNKVILENERMLRLIPDCCKIQEMCDKAVDTYSFAIQIVSECYKTQKMCDKSLYNCPFVFDYVSG